MKIILLSITKFITRTTFGFKNVALYLASFVSVIKAVMVTENIFIMHVVD
jgi:hypothetical protein